MQPRRLSAGLVCGGIEFDSLELLQGIAYVQDVMMLAPTATRNISLMEDLLKGGADVNTHDIISGNPLHAAAIGGHETAARLLIENGANLEYARSTETGTALC
jgi:ankyrin repeat protein